MKKEDNKALKLFTHRIYLFITNSDFIYIPEELQEKTRDLYREYGKYWNEDKRRKENE